MNTKLGWIFHLAILRAMSSKQSKYKVSRVKASQLGVRMGKETPLLTEEQHQEFKRHVLTHPLMACKVWQGPRNYTGYGLFDIDGQLHYTHKIAWQTSNGCELPPDYYVGHECNNPPCVDPRHLKLLSAKDCQELQNQRRAAKNRRKSPKTVF